MSETITEKSFLLLISATSTLNMSANGLVMPAWKRGFCFKTADNNVLPERGNPEIKWNLLGGLPFRVSKVICSFGHCTVAESVTRPSQ